MNQIPPFDKLPKTNVLLFKTPTKVRQRNIEEIKDNKSLKERLPETHTKQKQNIPLPKQKLPVNKVTIAPATQLASPTEKVEKQIEPDKIQSVSSPATPQKVYKIVSVDDSPVMLKEISRFLEDESFSVVTIDNPLKAVMSIIRHQPDLILLDLNMEGIDGYELCRIIRNNSKFKNTPIVMVTGSKGFVDKVKARLVGASGYLTKPFTRADLLKMVFMHLT